tara:strand:- start:504 stop:1295 length:792 start_codon:yes stop_codon:yes gene_type:complete
MESDKVLIDGDIVAYRSAASLESEFFREVGPPDLKLYKYKKDHYEEFLKGYKFWEAGNTSLKEHIHKSMDFILKRTVRDFQSGSYQVYLTGSNNFRHQVAKSFPYKETRKVNPKPVDLPKARAYLIEDFGAIVSEGEEADDLIAIEATRCGPTTIIASIDKDMLQIPCRHFNINRGDWTTVTQVSGLRFFYTQVLTGDASDNIKGVHGIGPKTAKKLLSGVNVEEEMWDVCVKAYEGDIQRIVENARLLWLRREVGEVWMPPK